MNFIEPKIVKIPLRKNNEGGFPLLNIMIYYKAAVDKAE